MKCNLIFKNGFNALMELSFIEDGKPFNLNVSQISTIGSTRKNGTVIILNNGKWVSVKESREEILESIERLQKIYAGVS